MPSTPTYAFPYPAGTDLVSSGPAALQSLAEDVEDRFVTLAGKKSIIATEESRTNVAYGTLTTPDQVTGIVVPTNGVLLVSYSALVKQSVASAASVAIFLGSTQVTRQTGSGAPAVQETGISSPVDDYGWVISSPNNGLTFANSAGNASSVATGMIVAAAVEIEVAAGTYAVSAQYKASSGSVTAKERKLRVRAEGY